MTLYSTTSKALGSTCSAACKIIHCGRVKNVHIKSPRLETLLLSGQTAVYHAVKQFKEYTMRIIKSDDHSEGRTVYELSMPCGGVVTLNDSIYAGVDLVIKSGSYTSVIPQEWFGITGSYDHIAHEQGHPFYNGITDASMVVAIPGMGDTLVDVAITLEDYFELLDVEQLQHYISHRPKKDN
jgi:hypothetical protein